MIPYHADLIQSLDLCATEHDIAAAQGESSASADADLLRAAARAIQDLSEPSPRANVPKMAGADELTAALYSLQNEIRALSAHVSAQSATIKHQQAQAARNAVNWRDEPVRPPVPPAYEQRSTFVAPTRPDP